jgi:TonB family protein
MRLFLATLLCCVTWSGAGRAQLEKQPTANDALPPLPPPRMERAPELLNSADPIYPDEAKAAGRIGAVVVRMVINDEGLIDRVDVTQSAAQNADDTLGRMLDWAAMGAVTNFSFIPASFCTSAYGPKNLDGDVTVVETCEQTRAVAIDYQTTFTLQQEVIEKPTEEAVATTTEQGPLNCEGIVREAGSKDPLEGVEVVVEIPRPGAAPTAPEEERYDLRTAYTDAEGRFSLRGIPDGTFRVVLSQSGYETSFVEESFSQKERTAVTVYLQPREANKFETVVRRKRAQKEVSKISLTREEVKRVPGSFGDPLRVIENLPGLARAPFAGGALIVRGANPQDSGVYFDGVQIPILYHFGGLTSVVNAEFLEDIDFYPGGFPVQYGRATAGIVDVSSRKLKMKTCRGYGELDLLDSGFFFACPLQLGELPKVTFAMAARRSYIDALLPIVLDTFLGSGQAIIASPVYWDYQAKLETTPLPGHTLSLFVFGSNDDLKVLSRNTGTTNFGVGFNQQFHRAVLRWDARLTEDLRHVVQPYIGVQTIRFNSSNDGNAGGPTADVGAVIETRNWGVRDELAWTLSPQATVRGGLDYLGSTFGVRFDIPLPLEIGSFPRVFPAINSDSQQQFGSSGYTNALAFYLEAEFQPIPQLKIVPGVRAETTVFTFLPDELADGTRSRAADVDIFHIDPRITARFEVVKKTTLKAAAGIFRQPPTAQQTNPDLGNPNLLEPRAVQLIAGVEQGLTSNINLDVQMYLTNRDLLVQSTSEVVAIDGSDEVDPLFNNNGGRGRTFGVEALLRHELSENFYGWIAYTLSRTVIDLNENSDQFNLTNFDQTHILTLVAQWTLPWAFTFGGRFRLVTGTVTDYPIGAVHDLDTTDYLSLGGREQRLPMFHQLDLRLDRKFVFDQFTATAYVDVLNVYNQQNVEGTIADYRSRKLQPIPSLPILPVFGMSGEF